ncbi:MAG: ATP synthase F1 subunit gamma [Candidatus Eisenbacteria bacterium]|uniref:ATP synthase gamma chain n=1 Tax=Eiseniibacteriota bacterium TaxID=2212470 RepID=A0A933SBQ8_UNCEI|nr:ATP synthase F1 subunit gamma [Candidatus Eisenbacteria bacterium]
MASLKDLRRRIRATKSMQQIFKAMEMVAAAKLRRAQQRAQASGPYSKKISAMLSNLSGAAAELEHPLFKAREVKKTALVLITADRGFAGTYNTAVLRAAEARLKGSPEGSVTTVVVGRKGRDYLRRRGYPVLAAYTDLPGEASLELARQITNELTELYLKGEVDRVEILYTHFVNAITRKITAETFLPIGADTAAEGPSDAGAIFEPNAEAIFAELLPRYATAKLYAALADSLASEHSARMVAMGSARKNAGELVDSLTLTRNRLRQAAITREISELVGGAEALK